MSLLLDSFWRAAAYLLMPRVIGLSLLPLLIAVSVTVGLSWYFWDGAYDTVRLSLENWGLVDAGLSWIESFLGPHFRAMLVVIILIALTAPLVIVGTLLLVALLMTPAIVGLVAERRFPTLERRRGAAFWQSALWSLGATLVALVGIFATLPLWLIPGVVLIVPPLIWGWLTARVMSFDVLAEHADRAERRAVMAGHRWQLLVLGIVSGFLGAAPTLIWAMGALTLVLWLPMMAVSVWLYTLVFAFSALWFAHYLLAALQVHRAAESASAATAVSTVVVSPGDAVGVSPGPAAPTSPSTPPSPPSTPGAAQP
jgi:Etoposide-induced protein 2.4 (EI24)